MVTSLNNAQLEILQLFTADLSDEEMGVLRRMLIEFRYWRLQNELDRINITPELLEIWGTEHRRTPYTAQNAKYPES